MAFVVLSGCTATNARRANEVSSIKRGTVVTLQAVTLAGQSTGIGMASGSTAGVIIGARSGGNVRSMLVGALVGQVVGAIAGHTLEKKLTETDGIEVSVRLETGDEIAIPQPRSSAEALQVGDKVRVILTGSRAIVEKMWRNGSPENVMQQSRYGESYNMRQRIVRLTREIEHFTSQVSRYRARATPQEKRCFIVTENAVMLRGWPVSAGIQFNRRMGGYLAHKAKSIFGTHRRKAKEKKMDNFQFDGIDKAHLEVCVAARDAILRPRVGDFVRFQTGEVERFSHDWEDDFQTSPLWAGSFYLNGSGNASFSGSLHPAIPLSSLTLTEESRDGRFWFFHHNSVGGGRGVTFSAPCRVYATTAQYKGYLTRGIATGQGTECLIESAGTPGRRAWCDLRHEK